MSDARRYAVWPDPRSRSLKGSRPSVPHGTNFNRYFVCAGIGMSMTLLTCNVIIQQRFSKHRSLATGISWMGFSVGNFVGAPLTELLLNHYGLRGTLALLGAIISHRIPLSLQFRSPQHFRTASNQTTQVNNSCSDASLQQ